ncbi:MAG: hypothetical protein HN742_41815 [Lentisphaerae bacterium]|jgi:hypothetical protein|nr:hypothetical protein [Lentisphaerota bacterium]MBT4818846.1 hypothetical protein [Lentisphaerota bacterium]MBT5608871.1 hypothetical protein [Lentisphaerota bacterium]MBT7057279.1 hypothetical protein [Lentisphaerota bacterium]MBT7848475.1 hypothetical protein [Lentisphaerota bacterium]
MTLALPSLPKSVFSSLARQVHSALLPGLIVLLSLAPFGTAAPSQYEPESIPLVDLTQPDLARLNFRGSVGNLVPSGETTALELTFGSEQSWPNIQFVAGKAFTVTDWSEMDMLAVTISNQDENSLRIGLRVDPVADEAGKVKHRQGLATLSPGEQATLVLVFSDGVFPGMRGQPRHLLGDRDAHVLATWGTATREEISSFQLFMSKQTKPRTIRIHSIELLKLDPGAIPPFVDRFGQYTEEEWPGKLHDTAEFATRLTEEEVDLATTPKLPGRSIYGGWADGPRLEATGRFRVQKYEGKWWFVDPEGRLFWSSGVTGLVPASGGPTKGRDHLFAWLPEAGDPLAAFYRRGKNIDFFRMNLHRKYGPGFEAAFADIATRRMVSWGFNTIGNWSHKTTWQLKRVPYTIPIHYRCPGFKLTWNPRKPKYFADVFSPVFAETIGKSLEGLAEFRDDPWLLGVFIDNELTWNWALATGILEANGETETQKRAVAFLREKHGTVDKLNEAWGTTVTDWDTARKGIKLSPAQKKKAGADLTAVCGLVAEQYFRVCREQMNEHMPGCLYLGSRFSSFLGPVVAAAGKRCDAVCFNIYKDLPDQKNADELAEELDFPMIIGEYHFGALDRGMLHTGLRPAKDQQDRAAKFAAYLETASQAPWCVGAHWFQFRDQALTGRGDGENYNIGFVTITDTPYPEMRAAARRVNAPLYQRRLTGRPGKED